MNTTPIELDPVSSCPDQDADVLGVYAAGGYIAIAAGAFGLLMARFEDLSRRQRCLGTVAALSTSALGLFDVFEPVKAAALLRRRLSPWVLPGIGLLGLAVSGAERSPMFYPGLILTGFGGGRLGRARLARGKPSPAVVLGCVTSSCYLTILVGAGRLNRSHHKARLLWNVGSAPLFFAAAVIGGELGDLALAVRRVEMTRKRDKEALAQAEGGTRAGMSRLARAVSETAAELDQTLLRIAALRRSARDASSREVQTAVEEVRGEIHHHQLAPLLVAAANDAELPLVASLDAVLDVYREGWRDERISIAFHTPIPRGRTLHPGVTSVLIRATKVALDNSHKHQLHPLTAVHVSLAQDGPGYLTLRIRDDGGGRPPDISGWGTGLSETHAHVGSVSGAMGLLPTHDGVELWVRVPTDPPAAPELHYHDKLSRRIDDSLLRCARAIRPATWLNGFACCLTARNRRSSIAHAAIFTALTVADRVWNRRLPGHPWRARSIVPAVSLLWPAGGRPTTGWAGLELVSLGAFGRGEEALGVGLLAFLCTSLSAIRVKHTVEWARLVENLAFPLVCSASGVAAAYARRSLEDAQRDSVGLRERAELIERLARTVRLHHDLIKPLRHSAAWYGEGIMASDDGQRLLDLSGRIDDLTHRLLGFIAVADPIADLRVHLQLRLSPTKVTVGGTRPSWTSGRARAVAVDRAREYLGLVALADELADHVLARCPPTITGRPRVERLHLDIAPLDDLELRVSLQLHPPDRELERCSAPIEAATRRLSGRVMPRRAEDALTLALPASTLEAL